ncbi:MAG: transketolase C-terminal domain-containing protein [Candidatus Euphemobacter frigidus]|nr:transketolase C-terminal domain-containing protein [Candidatus Euphemobacter frigidus]MDP8276623.1 transketolase C-terminal domain-containing protein [Candidatus Euphemobacter frigidus]
MRRAFINTLLELAEKDPDLYLLTGDTGFTILEEFQKRFPGRYYNIGISEAAMIGVSAGLAMSGKTVFVYTIVPFVTMRCFEQVRIDLCYQNLPVKLVGVGQGFTYGTAGATHHAIEDIAIMRALPNMTVICPGGPIETKKAVEESMKLSGPCYIRLGKSGEATVHESSDISFTIGKGIKVRDGEGVALVATSNMVPVAAEAADLLKKEGIDPVVVSMHTVKPVDRELIADLSQSCFLIATLEEHNVIGGLGSAVGDVILEEDLPVRLVKFAIPDVYAPVVGSQQYLREQFGLTPGQVFSRIKNEIL